MHSTPCSIALIWVSFLGIRFEVGGGGGKIYPPPLLELVRILLEIPNLTRKYTPICRLMSAFFFKKLAFFVQKSTFTQSDSVRAVLQIF